MDRTGAEYMAAFEKQYKQSAERWARRIVASPTCGWVGAVCKRQMTEK
jgi:hypothetical protein